MTGRSGLEDFAGWNDRMAQQYDPEDYHLRSGRIIRWIEGRRVAVALELLGARQGDRVLEVGCGAGNVLERVQAGRLVGIDLSPYLLAKSRRRLASRGASLLQANAEALPFDRCRFDAVLCTEVLEHVLHPEMVLEEMVRVATPSARLVVTVPNEPLINRLKGAAGALGLLRLVTGRGYQTAARMDEEWHLHALDLASTLATIPSVARVERVVAIPWRWLPLRYALLLRPVPEMEAVSSLASGASRAPAGSCSEQWSRR